MLTLTTTATEDTEQLYDETHNLFYYPEPFTAKLEHSLISIARWEAKFHAPYIPNAFEPGMKTYAEQVYYVKCMLIHEAPTYAPFVLMQQHGEKIRDYIADPHTATKIYRLGKQNSRPRERITAELVYYWMIRFNIPPEYAKWHFNSLMALIDMCDHKEQEKEGTNKMSHIDSANYRHELNKLRRKQYASGQNT